jgi:hypothetical protein
MTSAGGDALRALLGPNLTRATKHVAALIKKRPLNATFVDPMLASLMAHHPTRRAGAVAGFAKARRPPFHHPCLCLVDGDGDLRDAGWRLCLRNLYGRHSKEAENRKRVIGAFRAEAFKTPAMQAAKNRITVGKCAGCDKRCKLAVDHDGMPFAQIMDEFLEAERLEIKDVRLEWRGDDRGFRCRALAARWHGFHDERARLVGLCRSCNSAKGSGGYRRRK